MRNCSFCHNVSTFFSNFTYNYSDFPYFLVDIFSRLLQTCCMWEWAKFCHHVFKRLSAAEASKSDYMRERVKAFTFLYKQGKQARPRSPCFSMVWNNFTPEGQNASFCNPYCSFSPFEPFTRILMPSKIHCDT